MYAKYAEFELLPGQLEIHDNKSLCKYIIYI